MSTTIASANQKGGVAKTTTCLNLAHALAEHDCNVLLVDLDPQDSLTISLGIDVPSLSATLYNLLVDSGPRVSFEDVIRKTDIANVSLIPASIDLSQAEMQLQYEMDRERTLRVALKPAQDWYDFILLDCPPAAARDLKRQAVVAGLDDVTANG